MFFQRRQDGNRLLDDIVAERTNKTINTFIRVKPEDFEFLLRRIAPEIARMNTNMRDAITTQERLLILLHYIATGHTFSSLQFLFQVGIISTA